jgi:hypothetical protein
MDLNTLRDIIERDDGKIFVFEEGKPLLVLMSFEAYKRLLYKINQPALKELENKEVVELKKKKEGSEQKEKALKKEVEKKEGETVNDLEIEDLNL